MPKVLRDLRRGELSLKDMSVMRERGEVSYNQVKKTSGNLTDYSLQHTISLGWGTDFGEQKRDLRPFELRIDDKRYLLSWGELQDADRAGFFRREKDNPSAYRLRFFDGPKFTLSVALNDEAQRDMIFCLSGEGFEVYCDWYEWLRYTRFI